MNPDKALINKPDRNYQMPMPTPRDTKGNSAKPVADMSPATCVYSV